MTSTLFTLPFTQFKRSRSFYFRYDAGWLVASLAFIALLLATGYRSPVREFAAWQLLLLPLSTYAMIMTHVFIHNAAHGNFPRAINRVVGEICGVLVLTKFASWEIVHTRHHRYSDDPLRDPHPASPGYWAFAWFTLINVERQLQQTYFDRYGDTPENRRREQARAVLSFVSGLVLAVCWLLLFGAPVFFVLYLPAFVMSALFVIFFNWAGHNGHADGAVIGPTNLDEGVFWYLNRAFFGIFFHANHHKVARLFNPMKLSPGHRMARASSEDNELAA